MAVSPRLNREILIKGASINSTVPGRGPEDIGIVVPSVPTPKRQHGFKNQTALGPDTALNRRVFSVIANGFPVRLSQNQDQEDIQKEIDDSRERPWRYPSHDSIDVAN
ncbi:hypothetical protein E4U33_002363 [Claviceps sp. LM78 group G4]|nr:hypothetical protein E4U33_002363 [Claviceps sp. LM78 group G4]